MAAAAPATTEEVSVQACAKWLALVLDTEVLPNDPDSGCAEMMALMRSHSVTGRSLMVALADGRLLDRVLRRHGLSVEGAAAPSFFPDGDGVRGFVRWCWEKFPESKPAKDQQQQQHQQQLPSMEVIALCLKSLAEWPGANDSLPRLLLGPPRPQQPQPPQTPPITLTSLMSSGSFPSGFSRRNSEPVGGGGGGGGSFADMLQLTAPSGACPLEAELVVVVHFYRLSLAVADLLEKSPLSCWPADVVRAAFRGHRQLLLAYSQVWRKLRTGFQSGIGNKAVLEALQPNVDRLASLHASQVSQWQLSSGPAVLLLTQEEPRRQTQVRLALRRLVAADQRDPRLPTDMEQLQLLPAFQVKRLSRAVSIMAETGNHSQPLFLARELMLQLESRLDEHLKQLEAVHMPSAAALRAITGARPESLKFESLGQLRREGQVTLEMNMAQQRCRYYLWDGALVFVAADTRAYMFKVDITANIEFPPDVGNPAAFVVQPPHVLAVHDSEEERRAWLEAARTARDARHPRPLGDGHAFRQVYVAPETPTEEAKCSRCKRQLFGFAYRCSGQCGLHLDLGCIRTLAVSCSPVPKPRPRVARSESLNLRPTGAGIPHVFEQRGARTQQVLAESKPETPEVHVYDRIGEAPGETPPTVAPDNGAGPTQAAPMPGDTGAYENVYDHL